MKRVRDINECLSVEELLFEHPNTVVAIINEVMGNNEEENTDKYDGTVCRANFHPNGNENIHTPDIFLDRLNNLFTHQKIEGVKLVRSCHHSVGLMTARNWVEDYFNNKVEYN